MIEALIEKDMGKGKKKIKSSITQRHSNIVFLTS